MKQEMFLKDLHTRQYNFLKEKQMLYAFKIKAK